MFTADLSWTDPATEKVGERKERKAREKEKERSTSSAAPSISSVKSSKSSIPDDREIWWPSSLRKARSMKPSSKTQSQTTQSRDHTRLVSISLPQSLQIDTSDIVRDPTLQPAWTYSTTLSPTLPSGAPLEPPEYEVPELEGDMSSRGTDSSGSRSSRK